MPISVQLTLQYPSVYVDVGSNHRDRGLCIWCKAHTKNSIKSLLPFEHELKYSNFSRRDIIVPITGKGSMSGVVMYMPNNMGGFDS